MVCERRCVTKWCVKDGVSKMVFDKVPHCQPSATSATPATQNEGGCHHVPCLPRKMDVTKCHACNAKWRGAPGNRARPSAQPSAPSATPATKTKVHEVFCLPRKTKVDVAKCHACHAKWRGAPGDQSAPKRPPEPAECPKCNACHAKRRWMSPSATPARQKEGATQNEGGCHQVSCLPRWWMSRLPRNSGAASAMRTTRNEEGWHQVPRVPCKAKVDVAKFHACQAKWRGASGDQSAPKHAARASPVPQVPRLPRKTKGVPRLPGKVVRHPGRPKRAHAPPETAQCPKCHACHTKRRWM